MTQTNNLSLPNITEKVKIIGIGKSGVKIVNNLSKISEAAGLDIAAIDTDTSSITSSTVKNSFLIGEEWTGGRGCGGDIIKGERAISHKSNQVVKEFINGASLLIITGGLGGGTATGGAPIIARMAKDKNIPTIMIFTIPFAFEGHSKREISEKQLDTLMKTSYTVIPIPNDLLYSLLPASCPLERAFDESNTHIARTILGISELLKCNNLIPVDLCDLHNILCKQKNECGIGFGLATTSDGPNRTHVALQRLFDSPLLGGQQRIKEANAIIVSVTGGKDLNISDTKYLLDSIIKMTDKKTDIAIGANTDESYQDKIQITVIPIKYDKTTAPVRDASRMFFDIKNPTATSVIRNVNRLKKQTEQMELPFENQSRGIFTSSTTTTYKGEDLDIPTYQRRRITIDKGK